MLFQEGCQIRLHKKPTDMRKAIDGLSRVVIDELSVEPQNGDLFIFYNRKFDRVKVLFWQYNGFCLLQKRLEKHAFKVPKALDDDLHLTERQLYRLLEGLHFVSNAEEKYDVFY